MARLTEARGKCSGEFGKEAGGGLFELGLKDFRAMKNGYVDVDGDLLFARGGGADVLQSSSAVALTHGGQKVVHVGPKPIELGGGHGARGRRWSVGRPSG